MIGGFNSEIEHRGLAFHVQTEDKGRANPVIESLIYVGGQVVVSKREEYAELVENGAADEEVAALMDRQHKVLIAAIQSGRLDAELAALWGGDAGDGDGALDVDGDLGDDADPSDSARRRGDRISADLADSESLDEIVLRYLEEGANREHLVLALEENGELRMGRRAFLALRAHSSRGGAAVAGAEVQVKMISTLREPEVLGRGVTDGDGECFLNVQIPALENATAALIISAASDIGTAEVKQLL